MDLTFSPEDLAFRSEVRAYFANEYPQEILAKTRAGIPLSKEDYIGSQQALQAKGWYATTWPVEQGGPGWSPARIYIFDEELERAGAPGVIPMTVLYIGPVIYTFGTEAQKRRWLPDILASKSFWAQGYSEPEAGSDLTSLGLSALRDGTGYVLNGTKIWTSQAHWADWMFCLVRTGRGPRKDDGISFLCVEMSTPGIAVRPILSLDGSHHLNEVTFSDVLVPADNLIGEEGRGWRYARFLLSIERFSYAHVGRKRLEIDRLRALASSTLSACGLDGDYDARLARCEIDVLALETMVMRALHDDETAPLLNPMIKILATETAQRISELQVEFAGPAAYARAEPFANPHAALPEPGAPDFASQAMASYLFDRAQTIYGGTTEIQKNIVARELLRGQ